MNSIKNKYLLDISYCTKNNQLNPQFQLSKCNNRIIDILCILIALRLKLRSHGVATLFAKVSKVVCLWREFTLF